MDRKLKIAIVGLGKMGLSHYALVNTDWCNGDILRDSHLIGASETALRSELNHRYRNNAQMFVECDSDPRQRLFICADNARYVSSSPQQAEVT